MCQALEVGVRDAVKTLLSCSTSAALHFGWLNFSLTPGSQLAVSLNPWLHLPPRGNIASVEALFRAARRGVGSFLKVTRFICL